MIGDERGREDRAQADDRRDGQVDAAGDDDKALRDGHDGEHGTLPNQVGQVIFRKERIARHAHDNDNHHKRDQRTENG